MAKIVPEGGPQVIVGADVDDVGRRHGVGDRCAEGVGGVDGHVGRDGEDGCGRVDDVDDEAAGQRVAGVVGGGAGDGGVA